MSEINVEEDLNGLLLKIQEANTQLVDFREEIKELHSYAEERLSGLVERIDVEQETLSEQFESTNEVIATAHQSCSALIERARIRASDIVDAMNHNLESINGVEASNLDQGNRMETIHGEYESTLESAITVAEQSRVASVTQLVDVASLIVSQVNGPATAAIAEAKAKQIDHQSANRERLSSMREQDGDNFKQQIALASAETIEMCDTVFGQIERSKQDNEGQQESTFADTRDQLDADMLETSGRLLELGEQVRQIGGTVGDGVSTVTTLAQSSAIGLTTGIGALTSTYELLEEIKSAW